MPGLVRGVARTAVVAGTASAVRWRVQPRQAEKFAQRDAGIVAQREDAYAQQYQQAPPPAYERPPPQPQAGDMVQQLKDLADLKNQGILTEEEFAVQKARILSA